MLIFTISALNQPVTGHCVQQLIGGLADEKGRWQESVKTLQYVIDNIVGDILVTSGCIAYLGIFPVSIWVNVLHLLLIKSLYLV